MACARYAHDPFKKLLSSVLVAKQSQVARKNSGQHACAAFRNHTCSKKGLENATSVAKLPEGAGASRSHGQINGAFAVRERDWLALSRYAVGFPPHHRFASTSSESVSFAQST